MTELTSADGEITDGWLNIARKVPSQHCDLREPSTVIDLLVVHNISLPPREFGGPYIEALFLGTLDPKAHPFFEQIYQLRVSAHCLIRRDGEIVQFVPFNKRAWHAGVSCFDGREKCNDFSIGIELEGADDIPYTEAQYQQLAVVAKQLKHSYPAINNEHIVGHCDIAPERKTDPGAAFDWDYFFQCLAAIKE